MSASFCYEIVKPSRANTFAHGTSSDAEALAATFASPITSKDIPTLRAMHRATRLKDSLWNDIADALERLRGDDYQNEVSIKVWVEY